MKGKLFGIILWLGFIAISVYGVYPFFMNALLGIENVTSIGAYEKNVKTTNNDELQDMWQAAWEYNDKVRTKQSQRAFTYLGPEETDEEYEQCLRFGDDNTMGSVNVPAAGIDIPIAHGTQNKYLDYEAGHVYGTSLPVGGESTHAVIAGHSALQNADIFTNLSKVKEDDIIRISVLNKTLAYRVVRIVTVLPADEDPYLQIEPGRDLVTLYTCTPYGVNSHRLLVMGERDMSLEANGESSGESEGLFYVRRDTKALLWAIFYGSIPFVVAIVAGILLFKKKKKKKKKGDIPDPDQSALDETIPCNAGGDHAEQQAP